MKKIVLIVVVLFSFVVVTTSCKEHKKHEDKTEKHEELQHADGEMAENAIFQCPMDCEKGKSYGEKGNCPVCKMDLKEKAGSHDMDEESSHEHGDKDEAGHDEDSDKN